MPASPAKILELKQLLADRFGTPEFCPVTSFTTGFKALDELPLPAAALTEIVSLSPPGAGASLLLYGLLRAALLKGERVALIDGTDSFAPKGLAQPDLTRLLWLRCRDATEAIKAADLVARDGNVPLAVLFLTLNPAAQLRRIPATVWHRLQMLVEKSAVTLLVFTPRPQVGCARLRVTVDARFPLPRLHHRRQDLFPSLQLQVERRRASREFHDEELCRAVCA